MEPMGAGEELWAWKTSNGRAVVQAVWKNANFLKHAVLVSESIVSWGFGIGIFANHIGFAVGKLLLHCAVLCCHTGAAQTLGAVVAALVGGSFSACVAILASGFAPALALKAALLGCLLAVAVNHTLISWPTVLKLVRFIQEIVVTAEMLTLFIVNLAKVIVQVFLRGTYHILHLLDHISLFALLPSLYDTCAKVLMSAQTIEACRGTYRMALEFVAVVASELQLGGLSEALGVIRTVQTKLRAAQPTGEHSTIGRHPRASDVQRHVKYACACYGHMPLKFLGLVPYGSVPTNEAAFSYCSGCDDIVIASWAPGYCAPGYVLALDHSARCLVLSVRGSLYPIDLLTDLLCDAVPCHLLGLDGAAHSGMLQSARALSSELLPIVNDLLNSTKYADYSLVLAGHSLGAGVVAVLAAMWLSAGALPLWDGGGRLLAVGFGTPACLSGNIAAALSQHMTTWVIGNDMVPRFGLLSAQRVRDGMLELWRARAGVALSSADEMAGLVRALTERKPHPTELCTAGHVIWLDASGRGSSFEEREIIIVDEPAVSFQGLVLASDMFSIHVPQSYYVRLTSSPITASP